MRKLVNFSSKSSRQSSDKTRLYKRKTPSESSEDLPKTQYKPVDIKQWEEARCPICMEHPHNAVLLRCSSYDKGCRPYMCNTSNRHSNCLDQFCKWPESSPSQLTVLERGETPSTDESTHRIGEVYIYKCKGETVHLLTCPLCRGEISGWFVVEAARKYMNSRSRGCSYETCDFSGNYSELRKHARSEHPNVRPTEVDPIRQDDWMRLEQETDFSDMVTLMQSMNGVEEEEEDPEEEDPEEEEDIGGNPAFEDFQNPYNFDSVIQIIEVTAVSLLRNDDTNHVHNDVQSNFTQMEDSDFNEENEQMENSDFNEENDFIRSNYWEQMPDIQINHRQNSIDNDRNNLADRRPRRINYIRNSGWGRQTNNARRNRNNYQPYNVRRNY